ncbi:MAG: hypothetical protein M3313_11580, partial [Actinomycetota bacterium]|nr:hypothetical protein [Actinomycetota bacterium]
MLASLAHAPVRREPGGHGPKPEFVSHHGDQTALDAFDRLLESHLPALTRDETEWLRSDFLRARQLSLRSELRIGGSVLTVWEDELPTAWYYG